MCTLIFGIDVMRPGTILIGANRDEDPGRPSDPPGLLHARPRVVGGRDRVAGGTWLAVRDGGAVIAMLNRWGGRGVAGRTTRSRGLLALDVAKAEGADPARAALDVARAALGRDVYAPFTLAHLSPGACRLLVHDAGGADAVLRPDPGWHVLTHADLDDPAEPRTAALVASLRDWSPAAWDEAREGLRARLTDHGSDPARAVCIHDGPMRTVSSAIVLVGADTPRFLHAEGRPCEGPYEDFSRLLAEEPGA